MTSKINFDTRVVGLVAWGLLTVFTLLIYFVVGTREFTDGGLLIAWIFFSWNYYAYAFDKRMWPSQFAELYGQGKGAPGFRSFWFWFAVVVYSALLATIAFAG